MRLRSRPRFFYCPPAKRKPHKKLLLDHFLIPETRAFPKWHLQQQAGKFCCVRRSCNPQSRQLNLFQPNLLDLYRRRDRNTQQAIQGCAGAIIPICCNVDYSVALLGCEKFGDYYLQTNSKKMGGGKRSWTRDGKHSPKKIM